MSGKDFSKALSAQGYDITDDTKDYEESITSHLSAHNKETETLFLFIDFKNENDTANFFESIHSQLHVVEGNAKSADNIENRGANYIYQELTADDYYYRIIKVENTILFVQAKTEQKDDVKSLIKELNY